MWSFALPLSDLAKNPNETLTFPSNFLAEAGVASAAVIDATGQQAVISNVVGTMTFSRVDPSARAFVGHFTGTISWTGTRTLFSCDVDCGPLWGAPAEFL